jgi:two-component system chemotaxis response regulator CheY
MKLRALVVDDSDMVRQLLIQLLRFSKLAEWEFTEAADGAAAMAKFSPQSFDIVFIDWNMPKMSGTEFIRKARAGGKADHIPMIMVTG